MWPMIPALRRLAPAAVLLCSPLLRAQTPPAGDVLARLVPEGTVVYVQAPSLERLGASIRRAMAAFVPDQAEKFDIDELLHDMELPGSSKEIDHQKPIAFCLVLPATPDAEPTPTFLVPAVSAASYARSIAESGARATTTVDGSYVSVSMSPDSKRGAGPAAIALGLPAGDIVARIDVKRLVEHFRPMIDMGLGQMEMAMASIPSQAAGGMAIGPMMKVYADGIRSVIDSGQGLDIAVRLDGDRLEIAPALTVIEKSALADLGSKEKTDAKSLARFLDPDASFGAVVGMDQAAMLKRFKPLIDAVFAVYPEPMRSGFQKMMGSADELAAQMGSALCVSGDFGAAGLRYACYLHPRDPAKVLSLYQSMMKAVPQIAIDDPAEGNVDGLPVTRTRIRLDAKAFADVYAAGSAKGSSTALSEEQKAEMKAMLEKMYGKDGLAFTFATKGDVTVIVLGGDDAFLRSSLARMSSSGKLSASFARALDQVGDLNPCFVMQYNLGKVMHGMQELMGDALPGMPFAFPNLPATFTVSGAVDGRVWRGATSADLAELEAAVRAMKSEAAGNAHGTAGMLKARVDIASIRNALSEYAVANGGKFPDSLEVLVTKDVNGQTYLNRTQIPKDPWGREYLYDPPSPENPQPRVYCYGRDGRPGGKGEDEDVDGSTSSEDDE